MKVDNIKRFVKGWFVGNFEPTLIKTGEVEVAYKTYEKGEKEEAHFHKLATEVTLIVKGKVKMNDEIYNEGSIIVIEPNDVTDFEALEDSANLVVKYPGASDDKYIA